IALRATKCIRIRPAAHGAVHQADLNDKTMGSKSARGAPRPAQTTGLGRYYVGDALQLLDGPLGRRLKGRVQLLLTSPPYPLNRKKSYGNLTGPQYQKWFLSLAPR